MRMIKVGIGETCIRFNNMIHLMIIETFHIEFQA